MPAAPFTAAATDQARQRKFAVSVMISAAHRVPELETERLLLSAHLQSDFEDSAAMWAEACVVRFIGGRVSTPEESWSRLLRYAGMWPLLGYGYWCVRDRRDGRFVGEIGFADFRRNISPDLGGVPETGWALACWAHGQGFASEALRAALSWADRHLDSETICMIDDANIASVKLAQSYGYKPVREVCYKDNWTRIYSRSHG